MHNAQQTQEWPSTTTRKPRRISVDSRRRQEEDIDDRPQMPTRSSAIVDMPMTDLYPTVSNLNRHGIAVGQLLDSSRVTDDRIGDDDRYRHPQSHQTPQGEEVQLQQMYHQLPSPPQRARQQVEAVPSPSANINMIHIGAIVNTNEGVATSSNRRPRQRPQNISVPKRGVRRCMSAVTMSSDLVSFDGTEFEAMPAADDYMDDDQLQEYLDQLAKEEDRKYRERESLKEELCSASASNVEDRESLSQLLQHLDFGGDGSNDDHEAYLNRLLEEQMQAEEQYMSKVARRVSDMSC
ncbi:unnamed protein product [Cylindrotheca closterium]|uniref:Uncharacterized protein n=1 Tax=Cylindrotheca closterium TaxID=2856 RepID=A0AAD2CH60_9STRA|nr:unnamed protein product [Cylindrotheca closterium]